MPRTNTGRRTVIIGPPPTPNGDLHAGHIAGPYLAADVHARYLRATGRPVLYTTGTDDSQTYVVATAAKRGTTPQELAARSWHDIQSSLERMGIAVDGYAPFDDGYRSTVLTFVRRLYDAGKFRLRTVRLPVLEDTGEFLMEGLVAGGCPVCLMISRGGLCETCGHPNNFDELIDPHSTVHPDAPVTMREADILVLPLEEYRPQLTAYYADKAGSWRPRIVQLVRELLAHPLPDFPITYPTRWGIPAPFEETPGQVLNAWAEGMPASMYCTAVAQRAAGEEPASDDELWEAAHDIRLVYFLGFDNVYFWGITHLALLLAHEGRYVLPDTIISNEFYELEHDKFSTSSGHVIWTQDLLDEVPRDIARFYLALSAPETMRTNFSRAALDHITGTRLVTPWNRLAASLDKLMAEVGASAGDLPVSAAARGRIDAMTARFAGCYDLETFSLNRAADLIVGHLDRLDRAAAEALGKVGATSRDEVRHIVGGLMAEVRALVAMASPILIDAGAQSGGEVGEVPTGPGHVPPFAIRPFSLPPLGQPNRDRP